MSNCVYICNCSLFPHHHSNRYQSYKNISGCVVFIQYLLFTSIHCLQVSAVYKYPLFTSIHCLQVSTVYKCPLFASVHCLQVPTVYKYPLFTSIHCLQVSTVYSIHCLQVSSVYKYPLFTSICCLQVPSVHKYPVFTSIQCLQVSIVYKYLCQLYIISLIILFTLLKSKLQTVTKRCFSCHKAVVSRLMRKGCWDCSFSTNGLVSRLGFRRRDDDVFCT